MSIITKPFSWLLLMLYQPVENFGLAIILFALVVKLVMLPFQLKSKKSMMRMQSLQPVLKELEKKHGGNQQKYQAEVAKLYQEEKINPMSGCLWTLIPLPILIALYSVVRRPMTHVMGLSEKEIATVAEILGKHGHSFADGHYQELEMAQYIGDYFTELSAEVPGILELNFDFFGINLCDMPKLNFFAHVNWADASDWGPALCLFLIPFVSALLSWASMKISSASNPSNPQADASMKSMNIMMPLMSLWFCFIMPATMGIYWIANSLFGMTRDYILTKVYKKQLDKEDAARIAARSAREREIELKRLETERLKAEGKTEKNTNTSKKKIQANEKQKSDERKAALDKAERAARRERLGIKDYEIPASQVGNRRYARGRAYVPDRFSNPENAAAATVAAAAESEFGASIDENIKDDILVAAEETVETVETAEVAQTVETVAESEDKVQE